MAHGLGVRILTHSFRPMINALCQIGWQSERFNVELDGHRSLCLFADYGFRLRMVVPYRFSPVLAVLGGAGMRQEYRLAIANWSRHNAAAGGPVRAAYHCRRDRP
jgi:hypothetical protein